MTLRLTEQEAAARGLMPPAKLPNKYRAQRAELFGVSFASKREARRFLELKLRQEAGEISDLKLQPEFPIIVNEVHCGSYYADYSYRVNGQTGDQEVIIEDVKSVATRTPLYKLKKRLAEAIYGIEVREV